MVSIPCWLQNALDGATAWLPLNLHLGNLLGSKNIFGSTAPPTWILQFLIRMDYQWFAIAAKGALLPIPCNLDTYDANLVALPIERTEEFLSLLGQK